MKKIILASGSPRRKKLLSMLGLDITVIVPQVEEKLNPRLRPRHQAEVLSVLKANSVAEKFPDAVIIAADTIVTIGNDILGKPRDSDEARRMLIRLSGKTHKVITGFTVMHAKKSKKKTCSVETDIYFRSLSEKEIKAYIENRKPFDKAGSYAIQDTGALFIEKIEGDYYAAVGLPLFALCRELRKFGVTVI